MATSRAHNLKIGNKPRLTLATYTNALIECTACDASTIVAVVNPLPDQIACPVCGAIMARVEDEVSAEVTA